MLSKLRKGCKGAMGGIHFASSVGAGLGVPSKGLASGRRRFTLVALSRSFDPRRSMDRDEDGLAAVSFSGAAAAAAARAGGLQAIPRFIDSSITKQRISH